ncbi:hypothetical protein [Microbacterium timonense]|uniref:hypothetical protein n=1 Tax=Microbacterium timonense TaxID=2086576 RepID=UPI00135BE1BE|nr:hypothetical protein [Microbacterium timonense]
MSDPNQPATPDQDASGAQPASVPTPSDPAPAPPAPPAGYPQDAAAPSAPTGYPQDAAAPSAPTGYPQDAAAPSAPAAGYPQDAAPRYAPPAGYATQPPKDARPKTLAIVALALAAFGLILAFIPFVTWFSGIVLLAGFIVGLVALISKKHGGKGFSIAAVAVSVVGWIVSIVMTIASFGILGQAALDEAVREGTSSNVDGAEDAPADEEEPADAADDRAELEVVESAFGRTTYDAGTWWYTVIIDNPNEDYIFDFADIAVEALDASGTILDSSTDYRTILSGRTAITGTFFSVGDGEIVELSVRGPQATDATKAPLEETGAFTVEGVQATSDSYSTTVRGTVSGDFEDEQELVNIVVIARDAAGAIIGAESTYVDRLPSDGSKVQFEATFLDPLPADATFEAYPSL